MQQALGALLIISSVVLVSWKKQHLVFNKRFIFSSLAALSFGLAFTNDAFVLNNFDVPSYLTIAFIAPSLRIRSDGELGIQSIFCENRPCLL